MEDGTDVNLRSILTSEEIQYAMKVPVYTPRGKMISMYPSVIEAQLENVAKAAVDKALWNVVDYLKGYMKDSKAYNIGLMLQSELETIEEYEKEGGGEDGNKV